MDLEQASFEDVRKELEKSGGQMGEVLQRLLKLFERQRLETQRVLSMSEEKETTRDFVNDLLTAILSKNVDRAMDMLQSCTPMTVMQLDDSNGMSALHHAAKMGLVAVVTRLVEIIPALADRVTRADGRPAHWSCLMVLVDSWIGSDDQCEALRLLLWASSPGTFQVRSLTGNSVFHLAASHGNMYFMKRLCYSLCLGLD